MHLSEFQKFCKTLNLTIVDCHLGPAIQLRDRADYETVLKTMNTEDKVSWAIAEKRSNFKNRENNNRRQVVRRQQPLSIVILSIDSYLAFENIGPCPHFDAGQEMAKFFVRIMKDDLVTHRDDVNVNGWYEDNGGSLLLSDKDFDAGIFSFSLGGSDFILIAIPEIDDENVS